MRAEDGAQVAGAQVEDPVGQPQRGQGASARRDQVGVDLPGLLRRGVGEDLDLVELVHPQQAPVSRPAEPASRRKHDVWAISRIGQVGLVQDLVARQRRQRHLGRRDGPQVVALEVVGVVGELGQVAGGHHRLGAHQRRRADLLEGVGVAVERVLAQGPRPAGAVAPVHREHRARQLGRRARCRGCRARRRSPSGGRAGGRRSASASKPTTRTRRCPPARRRRGRRRTGRWGCAAAPPAARCRPPPPGPSPPWPPRRRPCSPRPGRWPRRGSPPCAARRSASTSSAPSPGGRRPAAFSSRSRRSRSASRSTSAGSTPRRDSPDFTASRSVRRRRGSITRRTLAAVSPGAPPLSTTGRRGSRRCRGPAPGRDQSPGWRRRGSRGRPRG